MRRTIRSPLIARPGSRRYVNSRPADAGFTLVEVMVSVAMITVVMAAAATFYNGSLRADRMQKLSQAATRLATDGLDRVRSLQAATLVTGRDQAAASAQWSAAPTAVAPYLGSTTMVYDPSATPLSTMSLPTSQTVVVDGTSFVRNWYLGHCWQPAAGGDCVASSGAGMAVFYRVIVAVTWKDVACPNGQCAYVATTLVNDPQGPPPVFNTNSHANPPTVVNPGPQTTDVGAAVNLLVQATGGAPPLTWSSAGLPPGLNLAPAGSVATISGHPTTIGSYSVTLSVTDGFKLTGSTTFQWTVTPPPALANPGDQTSTVGTPDSLAFTVTGGSGPFSWKITGLPAGLTFDSTTGAVRGTPTAVTATPATVTATVTDSSGVSSSQTFHWTVNQRLSVTPPPNQTSTAGRPATPVTPTAAGGTTPITWSITGLPAGLSYSASSGTISGTPATPGRRTVTVTATDASGATATGTFSWTVTAPPTVYAPDDQRSGVDRPVQPVTPTVSGGTGPFSWAVSGLPPGLSYDPSTGTMSGTPTATGRYPVTVTVTDGSGATASAGFSWTVDRLTIDDPQGTIVLYRGYAMDPITAHASGGSGTLSWSATNLPAGVSISSAGVISGTPSGGRDDADSSTQAATITVTDGTGASASRVVTFMVKRWDD